mmetsp:Transcript_18012/g.31521  ORF Transcript_18012/g.31521 Transcript_18012/m.31521 type:complete len:292 (+) Transcript_18012:14-889(+)
MIRRNARQRREYLYRKSLEGQERELYEKKRKIRDALAEGKPIPSELRKEEGILRKQIQLDDALNDGSAAIPDIDDEYGRAGIDDPKIFLTTCRDPSTRLVQFAKELRLIFPNTHRFNRGGHPIRQVVDACRANECTDLIIVHETRGEPDGIVISHMPYGPTAYFGLLNVVTRHDIKEKTPAPQQNPHLIFEKFDSKLGERVKTILKYLFPVAKQDSTRVITFANENDYISFRHHSFKEQPPLAPLLKEIGPRFEMRLYQVKLGTIEQTHADNEFSLRPFIRSAKKRSYLER